MSYPKLNNNFNIKTKIIGIAQLAFIGLNIYCILMNHPLFDKVILPIDISIISIPIILKSTLPYLYSNYHMIEDKIQLKNHMLTTPYRYNQLTKIRNEYITKMEKHLTRKHTYRNKTTLNLKLHKFNMEELFIHYYYLNFVLPNIFKENIYYDNDIYKTYDRVHKYIKDNNQTEHFNEKRKEFGNRKIRIKDIKSILS